MGETEAHKKWRLDNTTIIKARLHNKADADILEALQGVQNTAGYIKIAIREKIARDKAKK